MAWKNIRFLKGFKKRKWKTIVGSFQAFYKYNNDKLHYFQRCFLLAVVFQRCALHRYTFISGSQLLN